MILSRAGLARARMGGKHCRRIDWTAWCLAMRVTLSLTTTALLAACATAPAAAPPDGATAPSAIVAAPSRGARLLAAAGGDNAPTQTEIERVFGRADLARQDGAGASLTYRLQTCALLLLFEADERNAMRLSESHASARRAGEAAPSLEQCASEAADR